MKNYFKISDFNISGRPIPEDVADKIMVYHIEPMNEVAVCVPFEVWVSKKSGYRNLTWEKSRKRSGNSEHVFRFKGASDWTCDDFKTNKDALLQSMIENTGYTRFAIYDTFIHADYKKITGRWVFDKNWKRIRKI